MSTGQHDLSDVARPVQLVKQLHCFAAAAEISDRTERVHGRRFVGAVSNDKEDLHVALVALDVCVQHALDNGVAHCQVAQAAHRRTLRAEANYDRGYDRGLSSVAQCFLAHLHHCVFAGSEILQLPPRTRAHRHRPHFTHTHDIREREG